MDARQSGQGGGMGWSHIPPYWQPLEFIHHLGSVSDGREIVPRINWDLKLSALAVLFIVLQMEYFLIGGRLH